MIEYNQENQTLSAALALYSKGAKVYLISFEIVDSYKIDYS